jgi:anti-sigma B factor antagonist
MRLDGVIREHNERHPQAPVESGCTGCGDLVLALSGELEMKASNDIAPLLEAALFEIPARGRLLLDLSRVGYISSTGVGLLATTMISAKKRLITLVLLDVPPRVRNIMDTLGLLSFFTVEASRE